MFKYIIKLILLSLLTITAFANAAEDVNTEDEIIY